MKKFILFFCIIMTVFIYNACKSGIEPGPVPIVSPIPTTPIPTCTTKTITADTIDFCDDGDTINARGGGWYSYVSSGATVNYFLFTWLGYNNCSYALYLSGYVPITSPDGFFGMGTNLSEPRAPIDISAKTGIKFWYEHLGSADDIFRVKISSPNVFPAPGTNNNMYGLTFTASISWAYFQVPFSDFTQESGWGVTIPVSDALQNAEAIEWQSCDLESTNLIIDEIEFY